MKNTLRYAIISGLLLVALVPTAGAGMDRGSGMAILNSDLQPPTSGLSQGNAPQVDTAPSQVSYQGRVTVSGNPYSGAGYFKFAIVDQAGTTSYWSNDGTSVNGSEPTANVPLSVSAGLFNVLLGDTTLSGMTQPLTASVFSSDDRYLRVWFATSSGGPYTLLTPDRRVGAVPFALNAETLDGIDASGFATASHNHFGQTWTGASGAGLTLSGGATGLDASGASYGVYGASNVTGVYGRATSSGPNWGVYGESASSQGTGVAGIATATSGVTPGVWGQSYSPDGRGVVGYASAISGANVGVWGESASPDGTGVFGFATAATGPARGVYGYSLSATGTGVTGWSYGYGVYGVGNGTGVYGTANTTDGNYGVYGNAGGAGTDYGIYGRSDNTGIYGETTATGTYGVFGLFGKAPSGSEWNAGVYGITEAVQGDGVAGRATATAGPAWGVSGSSNSVSGVGVHGYASAATGSTYGVYGLSNSPSGVGVYGGGNGFAMQAAGHAKQDRTGGGWVKAMVYMSGGGIFRCYNSQGATPNTTPPCGFTASGYGGDYTIDFGFQVNDRFVSVTPHYDLDPTPAIIPVVHALGTNTVRVKLLTPDGAPIESVFFLIVY